MRRCTCRGRVSRLDGAVIVALSGLGKGGALRSDLHLLEFVPGSTSR
jgi:hypothetical protein